MAIQSSCNLYNLFTRTLIGMIIIGVSITETALWRCHMKLAYLIIILLLTALFAYPPFVAMDKAKPAKTASSRQRATAAWRPSGLS